MCVRMYEFMYEIYICTYVYKYVRFYVHIYMYVSVYIYVRICMYVIILFNTHLPILIRKSGKVEGYAATLCTVPLDLISGSGYATVPTVYSPCVYILLGYSKKIIYRKFIHVEVLE